MFTDGHLSMSCINLDGYNNEVTSLIVHRTQSMGAAQGMWQSITGSSSIEYQLQEGFTSTHTEYTSVQNQFTLSYEMSESINFVAGSEESKIGTSYSLAIQNDVEDTYQYETLQTIGFTCDDIEDPSEGVGLWQWVVKTSDGKTKTLTKHWVCRYGPGYYNKAPECPWNACIDGNCYECESGWQY